MTPDEAQVYLRANKSDRTGYLPSYAIEALETVAGLKPQWGVEAREHFGGLVTDWHLTITFDKGRSRESAQAFMEGRKDNPGYEYRLVHRYVSDVITDGCPHECLPKSRGDHR